ncbi:MAG: DUF58 domain-containing protein [Bryobacteraceae bacterium]
MVSTPLLDREFLEKLERLSLRWQKSFPGLVGGHNPSRFAGAGQEFLDHRNFHHGDDIRAVNWRAYLRLEKLFLKMFQVEPRVPIRLLLDISASMGTGCGAKFDYARRLAGALCYVGLVRLDAIEIHPFAEHLGRRFLCSGGRHRFAQALDFLGALEATGPTDYFGVTREFISTYSQRGLLIVISDFLDDKGCEKPLQYLADFGHELMLVQLWADEDREPPWTGELDLVHAESGEHLKLQFDQGARARYTEAFDRHCLAVRQMAMRNGGRYVGVPTSVTIEEVVFGPLLRARSSA